MRHQIPHFRGLFGDDHFGPSEARIHLESLKVRSSVYDYEISEHVHAGLAQLFFIESGQGEVQSEGNTILFQSPCIVFVPRGVLHGFLFSRDISGEVLTMDAELFEECLGDLPNVVFHFQELRLLPFHEKLSSFDELMGTRQRFHMELAKKKVAREKIIQLLLQILILRLYRLVVDHEALTVPSDNRTLGHYRELLVLARRKASNALTVRACATQLNMSTGHLNRICRDIAGKSTQQLIHEQLARAAKRRLLTSQKSIAEIAYELDFKDPSHFSKFFKKQTGSTANSFRRQRG